MPGKPSQRPGEQLRESVLDRFDLDAHEVALLERAAAVLGSIADLQAAVDRDGPLRPDGRALPALVERRQQQLEFGRLVPAWRIPADGERLQQRGVRGFYGPRGVA